MSEIDELKSRISSEWLGKDGVCGVGVELEGSQAVVVISLIGADPRVISRLRAQYAADPVRIRTDEGPVRGY